MKKTLIIITAAILLAGISPIIAKAEMTTENETENTEITVEINTEETETENEEEIVTEDTTTEEETAKTVTYQAVRIDNVNLNSNGFEYAIAYVTDVQTEETQKVIMNDTRGIYGSYRFRRIRVPQ